MISLEDIKTNGGTQSREGLDQNTVEEYTDAMKNGAEFPPVVIVGGWLVDGFHRVAAARAAGWSEILAICEEGTKEDAQWRSFGVNNAHGLRRNNRDKRKAVKNAIKHPLSKGLSFREIARHTGVDHHTVKDVWDEMKYAGENPHDPCPDIPAWYSLLQPVMYYPYDDRARIIWNLPAKGWANCSIPWGYEKPDHIHHMQGDWFLERAHYRDYKFLEPPPEGESPFWLARFRDLPFPQNCNIYLDNRTQCIYPIRAKGWNIKLPKTEQVTSGRHSEMLKAPWQWMDWELITDGPAYDEFLVRFVSWGNEVLPEPTPTAPIESQASPDLEDEDFEDEDELEDIDDSSPSEYGINNVLGYSDEFIDDVQKLAAVWIDQLKDLAQRNNVTLNEVRELIWEDLADLVDERAI